MFGKRRLNTSLIGTSKKNETKSNQSLSPALLSRVNESPKACADNSAFYSEKISAYNPYVISPMMTNFNSLIRRQTPIKSPWCDGLAFIHKIKPSGPRTQATKKHRDPRTTFMTKQKFFDYKPRLLFTSLRIRGKSDKKVQRPKPVSPAKSTYQRSIKRYIPICNHGESKAETVVAEKSFTFYHEPESTTQISGWD